MTLLAGRAGEFGRQPLARGFLQLVERFEAERLGELVVDGGVLRRLDRGRGGLELGRLAGQLFAGVVLRERDLQVAGFAGGDADQLLFEAGNELAGADHDLDILAGAAVERSAVDGALEGDRDPIAGFGLGAFGLGGVGAVLVGDTLDGLIDVGVGDLDDRLLDGEALEIGELDRGHDLDRNRVSEIGFAGEDVLDRLFLGRHRDLGLGRQPETALGEDLRIGVADGLLDGLGHHRAAIDLLEMADRHLAGTEAIEPDLVLEVDQTGVRLGIEIRCGNADLESCFNPSARVSVTCMASIFFPLASGLVAEHSQSGRRAALRPAPVVRRTQSRGHNPKEQVLQQSSCKRCRRLVRAEGIEPPQLSSLEPKSSASTSSATPAGSISPAAMPRAAGL